MRIIAFVSIAVLTAIDQLIKVAVTHPAPISVITVIPGLLEWRYMENRGAAFGIFMALTICVIIAAAVYLLMNRCKSKFLLAAITLIIAGGVGNLIDRIFLGYVIDYIYVTFFPFVFNFADCCVCIGAALFVIYILFIEGNGKKARKNKGTEQIHEGTEQPTRHAGAGGGKD